MSRKVTDWARTPWRRGLLVVLLVCVVSFGNRLADLHVVALLANAVAVYVVVRWVADAWNLQVAEARRARRVPPQAMHAAVLNAHYNPDEVPPHILAGWDQVAGTVTDYARSIGLDVDDPYTLTVLAAALVMARVHHDKAPVTLQAALHLHETVWKVRLRELDRHGAPSTDTP